jgi:hypothetical protein
MRLPDGIAADIMKHPGSLFFFYEIIPVSVSDSLIVCLHFGLVFWWSTCDCQPGKGVVISEFYELFYCCSVLLLLPIIMLQHKHIILAT